MTLLQHCIAFPSRFPLGQQLSRKGSYWKTNRGKRLLKNRVIASILISWESNYSPKNNLTQEHTYSTTHKGVLVPHQEHESSKRHPTLELGWTLVERQRWEPAPRGTTRQCRRRRQASTRDKTTQGRAALSCPPRPTATALPQPPGLLSYHGACTGPHQLCWRWRVTLTTRAAPDHTEADFSPTKYLEISFWSQY